MRRKNIFLISASFCCKRIILISFSLTLILLGFFGCGNAPYYKGLGSNGGEDPNKIVFGDDDILHKIVLVGDAGNPGFKDISSTLQRHIDSKTVVIFLGDNVYDYEAMEENLSGQLSMGAASGYGALFLPGNHDWHRDKTGVNLLHAQAKFILEKKGIFLPKSGCPGPAVFDELERVKIIALDSHWWLLDQNARESDSECVHQSEEGVIESLQTELREGEKYKIVVAHHPMETNGSHAGKYPWYRHLLPPVFGTAFILLRKSGVKDQDVTSAKYKHFIERVESAMAPNPPLIYAAGHEHALQIFERGDVGVELVSGSGSKYGYVGHSDRTLFSHGQKGFMIVYFLFDGRVALRAFSLGDKSGLNQPRYSKWLVKTDTR